MKGIQHFFRFGSFGIPVHRRLTGVCLFLGVLLASATFQAAAWMDPTQPYRGRGYAVAPQKGLQSTLITAVSRRAVIDGRLYAPGDRYGDAVILEIRPYAVVLKQSSGRISYLRLVPPLEKKIEAMEASPRKETKDVPTN